MGKIAILFPGQGAQYSGMGADVYRLSNAAKKVFDTVDSVRERTSKMCFEGTEDELKETKNTQPCMFACELAVANTLKEKGIKADMTAGFSLGEISALTYSGAADLETGAKLVSLRGLLMQECAEKAEASMAAVVKLTNEQVESLCASFDEVYPVNYNCPGQITVAGKASEMEAFKEAVKEAGGRAIPLKVGGGFHSPFMKEASEKFKEALSKVKMNERAIPLFSNMTAEEYTDDYAGLLSGQICSPVRFEDMIKNMRAEGADIFIEAGPGKVLCGLIKKIDPEIKTYACATAEEIELLVKEIG